MVDSVRNAPIIYSAGAVPGADALFESLKTLNWEHREAPRQEYYCNDFPNPYVYGKGRGQRLYTPQPYTEAILAIRHIAEKMAGARFEVCFLNRYMNQKDQLGWHADDSPEMDDARPIAIVSFGVEREIWFRSKTPCECDHDQNGNPSVSGGRCCQCGRVPRNEVESLKLGHGSICLMTAGMQDRWQHRIPKASFECGERISLTFRGYVQGDVPTIDHSKHGRTDWMSCPEDSDCVCRGTEEQGRCASTGCGFCVAAEKARPSPTAG